MKHTLKLLHIIGLWIYYESRAQSALPILQYHHLYQTHQHNVLVWIFSTTPPGQCLLEHSYNGLNWQLIRAYSVPSNAYHYSFPKTLWGFARLRWATQQDTTTLLVHSLQQITQKGLFAYYDTANCKISLGYQIHWNTDLLLRIYNSIGEEVFTHFLYYEPAELHFWNFELPNLKKDVYLLRLIDALSQQIIADYRLPIQYDNTEKKPD